MLMSRKSDTHNHLARRLGKKHSGLHTVTTGARPASEVAADAPKAERPFGELQFDSSQSHKPANYKSILGL